MNEGRARHGLAGLTLLLVSSLTVMAGATIAPALPAIERHFMEVPNAALWVRLVLTLPAIVIVLMAPLAGIVADRWGRLKLLNPSLILYGLAGGSGFFVESLTAILAGRVLLGVAVAGVMTSATTLIADYFDGPARARFMGWQASFMSLGGVLFLTGGGLLADVGWRLPFLIYLGSLPLLPLVLRTLTEPIRDRSEPLRPRPPVVGSASSARLLVVIYGVSLVTMTIFYLVPLQIPFYLAELVSAMPSESGLAISVSTFVGGIMALLYGRVRARAGFVTILSISFSLMGTGFLIVGAAQGYGMVLVGLGVGGLGMGLTFPNLTVWLTSQIPAGIRGRAVGGLTTAIFLGQFLTPLVSQPLVPAIGLAGLFSVAGVLLLGMAVVFLGLRKRILAFTVVTQSSGDVDVVRDEPDGPSVRRRAA